ncbi:MAG TPA: hypothetical protein VJH92_03620 [Candidatus Nanoarchaeia archaeon]|nr:hypothetical protein [Candidatus Nanoarchaeia archaeon]
MVIDAGGSWAGDNEDIELSRARNVRTDPTLMDRFKSQPKIPYQGKYAKLAEFEELPGEGYRITDSDPKHRKRITYLTNTGIIILEKAE